MLCSRLEQLTSGILASLTVSMFVNPVLVPATALVPPLTAAAEVVILVEPVVTVVPVLTPLLAALLLGPSPLPLMPTLLLGVPWLLMLCLGRLDTPLVGVPSLLDGLFDPGLPEERAAECPLLSDLA